MEVRRIEPGDDRQLAAWHAVLAASDRQDWPEVSGYTLADVTAFAHFVGASRRFELLAATPGPGEDVAGVALMEFPLRDNRHGVEITLAVHPAHRRRGVGLALVERMAEIARADGRSVLNSIVDVPVAVAQTHPSLSFAPRAGFESTLPGNIRHLRLPVDPVRLDELRAVVAGARAAGEYRTLTFEAPWPGSFVDDQCALLRIMSTDEPAGDDAREEEIWDAERIAESDALRAARRATTLAAVALHVPSGRLVAMSELLLPAEAPEQAWQMVTVVDPSHRGHRLGLAVKIANLDALARHAPDVRIVVTGNAATNAPMIAVNEMLGFEVTGAGRFWQRAL
jgi:GNAT superfamily N-acetyltransferase